MILMQIFEALNFASPGGFALTAMARRKFRKMP